jgi:hypothetical protein
MVSELEEVFATRGVPMVLRRDNSPELIS